MILLISAAPNLFAEASTRHLFLENGNFSLSLDPMIVTLCQGHNSTFKKICRLAD